MVNPKQPERWESIILAALMSVAGSLFFFDKLKSLMGSGILSWHAVLHSAPALLVVVGASLLFADQKAPTAGPRADRWKESRCE